MAGYTFYSEAEGTGIHRMYDAPFAIVGVPKPAGHWDRPEPVTLSMHATREVALAWVRKNFEAFSSGPDGFQTMAVENWNE